MRGWRTVAVVTVNPGFEPGDSVVIVAGAPPYNAGSTNLIRVHRLGRQD